MSYGVNNDMEGNPKDDPDFYVHFTQTDCFDRSIPILQGMDVVTYFTNENGPVKGDPHIASSLYGDFTVWFSSVENMNIFNANPKKYAPAWGSFCAYGMAYEQEDWTENDAGLGPPFHPYIYTIGIDGRLYMFRDEGVKELFLADQTTAIERGNYYWKYTTHDCFTCFDTYRLAI
jgi:hypothetical protein